MSNGWSDTTVRSESTRQYAYGNSMVLEKYLFIVFEQTKHTYLFKRFLSNRCLSCKYCKSNPIIISIIFRITRKFYIKAILLDFNKETNLEFNVTFKMALQKKYNISNFYFNSRRYGVLIRYLMIF